MAAALISGYMLAQTRRSPEPLDLAMGLFDFLNKKKSEAQPRTSNRELSRLERMVANKLSQNFDRQEAIEELGKMATGPAAAVLLKRFDWTLDPSITDHEEKEACLRGIIAAGEAAIEPIREYCRKAESLNWPLKALGGIVSAERRAEELLEILDQFDTEYVRNAEPKVQLIAALEEFPTDDVRVGVEPFLGDMSEPVRFAATTTILVCNDEASVPALIAALETEESLRIKNRIAQGLAERAWSISEGLREVTSKSLPPGYHLAGGVVRRG